MDIIKVDYNAETLTDNYFVIYFWSLEAYYSYRSMKLVTLLPECRASNGRPSLSHEIDGFGFPLAEHVISTVRSAGDGSRRNGRVGRSHRGGDPTSPAVSSNGRSN